MSGQGSGRPPGLAAEPITTSCSPDSAASTFACAASATECSSSSSS
ncbi:hypothetical protein ACFV2U_17600 [Streptomyces sp. NPDC059697]